MQLLDGLVGCTDSCSLQGRVAELAAVSMREAALVPSTGDILAMGLTLTACFEYLKGSSPTSLQIPIFEENSGHGVHGKAKSGKKPRTAEAAASRPDLTRNLDFSRQTQYP